MSDIKIKEKNIKDKTGVWYLAADILKENKIKNTGGNQYVLMCWLKDNNKSVIKNDFIQRNSIIKIPSSKIDVLQIFCKELKLNQTCTEYFDLIECDHNVDGAVEVAKYIVQEIKTNIRSKEAIEIYDYLHPETYFKKYQIKNDIISTIDPITLKCAALLKWIDMVDTGHPWDHKLKINENFRSFGVHRPLESGTNSLGWYHKYQYHDYFLDVWSNIHYGFVGRYCGFSESLLLTGSNIQQIVSDVSRNMKNISAPILAVFSDISQIKKIPEKYKKVQLKFGDDPADKISMSLGMKLFDTYRNRLKDLSEEIVLNEFEMLESIGKSRLLHYCYDLSATRFTQA
ncbi:MAG: polymorphic toxin type 44 domain-containing protein [Acutalibacteraceae bacterium]